MPARLVTVFGGTGFLGREIVKSLHDQGVAVRIAVRHPERARPQYPAAENIDAVAADVRDPASVAAATAGADAVVNAVGLYVERGDATFEAIHVGGARNIAAASRAGAVGRLVHISGIGANPGSRSAYVRCRAAGEATVQEGFSDTVIVRPSVMFGPTDVFLNTLLTLVNRLPVLPLFGRGETLLQPVFVGDVAYAVAQILRARPGSMRLYELGGPSVYTYRHLLERVMQQAGRRCVLIPVPYFIWTSVAVVLRPLPSPPITEAQVCLMKQDNVASPEWGSLSDLGISPTRLEAVLQECFQQR
jgi:NADH dehydrogenase